MNLQFEKSNFLHSGLNTEERILNSHIQFDLFFIQSLKSARDLKLPLSVNKSFTYRIPQVIQFFKKREFPLYKKLQLFHIGCCTILCGEIFSRFLGLHSLNEHLLIKHW